MNAKFISLTKNKFSRTKSVTTIKSSVVEEKNKVMVSIFPNFSFEVAVGTYIDLAEYTIVPIKFSQKSLTDKYAQNVFGDWCYPLKAVVAMYEQLIYEHDVKKIIGLNVSLCAYPFVLGNIQKWIDKKIEYYPITNEYLTAGILFPVQFFKQLGKAFPDLSKDDMVKKIPLAVKRVKLARSMTEEYYKHLPLVKNPNMYKRVFTGCKLKLINAKGLTDSLAVLTEFKTVSKKMKIHAKPKHRFLLSGDASIVTIEFILFDLDIFLAQQGVEIVKRGFPSERDVNGSDLGKKAHDIFTETFSNNFNTIKASTKHDIEIATLYQILSGIDDEIDGIIFIKPNMCSPCDNLSYVLKNKNYFGHPFVEISYDEHSGANGIETRLEAFINIVKEK